MNEQNVNKLQVFNKAAGATGEAVTGNLRRSFQFLAPKINPDLIAMALRSFGQDHDSVTLNAFMAIFDEEFDKNLAPSNNNTIAKKKTTKSATKATKVSLDDNEINSIVLKLDQALLKNKMGPFDAFKAADLNKNGIISANELRHQVKNLLGPDAMKSVDLKLLMLAFD